MGTPWASIIAGSTAVFSAVARIERDRWHADLLPQFSVRIEMGEGDRATLSVRLVGPLPLCHLDEIRVEVAQSDDMDSTPRLAGRPTEEQVAAQVWGPLRFVPGSDGADRNGHTVVPFALTVGRGRPFALERTRSPLWWDGNGREERWRDKWLNLPMRLVLTCSREGFEPWTVPYEVDVPEAPRVRFVG